MANYCIDCGGTGELLNGERCTCLIGRGEDYDSSIACLVIPEQYRGVTFDEEIISTDGVGIYYRKYLRELYNSIISMKFRHKNVFISSPHKKGKTVFAYSCIQSLFRRGVPTFPVFDILEVKSIMWSVDAGKIAPVLSGITVEPLNVYLAPILFVKIPSELTYAVYDALYTLVDRRTRRGNGTIILSSVSWNLFVDNDKKGLLAGLVGDGSFGTIENKTFWVGGGSS